MGKLLKRGTCGPLLKGYFLDWLTHWIVFSKEGFCQIWWESVQNFGGYRANDRVYCNNCILGTQKRVPRLSFPENGNSLRTTVLSAIDDLPWPATCRGLEPWWAYPVRSPAYAGFHGVNAQSGQRAGSHWARERAEQSEWTLPPPPRHSRERGNHR